MIAPLVLVIVPSLVLLVATIAGKIAARLDHQIAAAGIHDRCIRHGQGTAGIRVIAPVCVTSTPSIRLRSPVTAKLMAPVRTDVRLNR